MEVKGFAISQQEIDNILYRLYSNGASIVGTADISDIVSGHLSEFKYAISIIYKMSSAIMREELPTYQYFQHYRTVNAKLDSLVLDAVNEIEKLGYLAYPIPASQSIPNELDKYSATISHKAVAIRCGLGFIGKSNLFVTPQFGSAVRLATVLTNLELCGSQQDSKNVGSIARQEMVGSKCETCNRCVDNCPAGALTGKIYEQGDSREKIFNAKACSEYMKKAYNHIGRGVVCGKCICHGHLHK